MYILYKGEMLNLHEKIQTEDHSFFNEDSLWITSPEQRNKYGIKFVGGYPNEWAVALKDITDEYSIEKYNNKIIGLIIKENDTYMAYLQYPTSFDLLGNGLKEAKDCFWGIVRQEDRYNSFMRE